MSRRWTNFIKGPSLHDTILTYNTVISTSEASEQEGEGPEVAKFYEEVINEPSARTSEPRKPSRDAKKVISQRPPGPPPSFPALLKLAESDSCDAIRCVIESHRDLDLNQRDEFGWTLLMVAACAGAVSTVGVLLENGADSSLTDKKGQTALALARKKNQRQVCQVIDKWQKTVQISAIEIPKGEQKVSGSCDPCGTSYEDRLAHERSIVHLLSTSEGTVEKTHYGIPESNRGFQLMVKTGWDRQSGLGPEGKGQKFPVKTVLKQDRVGLGSEVGNSKRARVTHFPPLDPATAESSVRPDERVERKRTVKRREEARKRNKEVRREIDYRRQLSSL